MHMPEMWGYVQFTNVHSGEGTVSFVEDPDEQIKWALWQLYFQQQAYYEKSGHFSSDPDSDFFPFRSETGDFCVANKRTITHVRFEPPKEEPEFCPLGNTEEIDIKFVGGEQLSGTILIEMPEGKSRLFDFVNATDDFFLLTNQEAHYLVNVDQIRDVSPRRG